MAKRAERRSDPSKLVGLLWHPPSVAGRSGLTPRKVIAAAIEVADQEGLDALTMRRVAEELDVSAMALYPYIAGRAELIELMVDAVAHEVYASSTPPGLAGDWRAGIEQIAWANWNHYLRHPWLVDVAPGRAIPGPGIVAKYEAELTPLEGLGLDDIEMDSLLTSVLDLVSSAARWTISLQRIREETALSDLQWWQQVAPALSRAMSAQRFPLASRVGAAVSAVTNEAGNPEGVLRYGLERLLDGLALRLSTAAPLPAQ